MLLTDLPFPVTVVAPDGWAEYTKAPDDIRNWGMTGIRKYNRIGFIVADGKGAVWRMVAIQAQGKVSLWDRLRLMPALVPAEVTLEPVSGDPLAIFRDAFLKALEKDDDSLTQFHSTEQIKDLLSSADSLSKLLSTLHRMRVT